MPVNPPPPRRQIGKPLRLSRQHAEWAGTLAPLAEVPEIRAAGPVIPGGHGWAFAAENGEAD